MSRSFERTRQRLQSYCHRRSIHGQPSCLAIILVFSMGIVGHPERGLGSSASGFRLRIKISIRGFIGISCGWAIGGIPSTPIPATPTISASKKRPADVSAKSFPTAAAHGTWKWFCSCPARLCGWAAAWGRCRASALSAASPSNFLPTAPAQNWSVTYAVSGYLPAGMNTWAAPVDSVLTGQFIRLKNYVERGDPAKNEAEKQK